MTEDIVYIYPQSSCPCENCHNAKCVPPKGAQTNMSVRGCEYPKCLDCNNRIGLNSSIQPQNNSGIVPLNPQVYTDKFSKDFGKIPCKQPGCPSPSYIAPDPRLYSTTRANYLPLDRPPIDGSVRLKNMYKKDLDDYGQGYTPYNQVRAGQIEYYIDKSIQDPFFEPVFATKADVVSVLYKDPMGGLKPEYSRVVKNVNPTTTSECYPDCLSFIQDSQSHREDLMSFQMRKRNQEKWSARWPIEPTN